MLQRDFPRAGREMSDPLNPIAFPALTGRPQDCLQSVELSVLLSAAYIPHLLATTLWQFYNREPEILKRFHDVHETIEVNRLVDVTTGLEIVTPENIFL